MHWQATKWFGECLSDPWYVGQRGFVTLPSFLQLFGKDYFGVFSNPLSTFRAGVEWDGLEAANADGGLVGVILRAPRRKTNIRILLA